MSGINRLVVLLTIITSGGIAQAYPGLFHDPNYVVNANGQTGLINVGYNQTSNQSDRLPEAVKQYWNSNFLIEVGRGMGSAFKIKSVGNKTYVGTALHVIRGGCPSQGVCQSNVSIKHNYGFKPHSRIPGAGNTVPLGRDSFSTKGARVVKVDPSNDLAILEIDNAELANDQKHPPMPITNSCPRPGDKQYAICHPPAWNSGNRHTSGGLSVRPFKHWSGGVLTRDSGGMSLAASTVDSIQGSSGCGQMNERGELTALLTGGPTGDTTYSSRNHSFITRCQAFTRFYKPFGVEPGAPAAAPPVFQARPGGSFQPEIIQTLFRPQAKPIKKPQPILQPQRTEDDDYNNQWQYNPVGSNVEA